MIDQPEERQPLKAEEQDEDSWLEASYPVVSSNFVDRVLGRVIQDEADIAEEAARVENYQFPEGFLVRYEVPEPSSEFVDRTLEAVLADDRQEPVGLADALQNYEVPEPSSDFVERTLEALSLRAATPPQHQRLPVHPMHPMHPMRRMAFVLAAAAVVLVTLSIVWDAWLPDLGTNGINDVLAATTDSAVPWATDMAGLDGDLDYTLGDPLKVFVHLASLPADTPR